MDSATITALATGLLVIVGLAQVGVLIAQRRQSRLELVETYWRRWRESRKAWGTVVFFGREDGEFYQVAEPAQLDDFRHETHSADSSGPTTWALDAIRSVSGVMSDVCIRVLQGQIDIGDAYPIFGSELLRQSRPLRVLLDSSYPIRVWSEESSDYWNPHQEIRRELQTWLVYHDGVRRRCLILLDLLWAEAARLEDLPPDELLGAANAKRVSGHRNRDRLSKECIRLRGPLGFFRSYVLSRHIRHAEHKRSHSRIGLDAAKLKALDKQWEDRLLHGLRP